MSSPVPWTFSVFFNDTATTEIYTLSLHDALPIWRREPEGHGGARAAVFRAGDPAARAARRAHADFGARQFAARADHGAGASDAGEDFEARARHRRADHLPPQRGFDRRLAARFGGVSKAEILVLDAAAAKAAIGELAEVLADCVEGGASVSFMLPYSRADAAQFFEQVIASVARGATVLVAGKLGGRIVGTVQLGLDMPPNQPHRADIKKLLVHRVARKHGLGAALMERAESEAKARGRTLLVLDTDRKSVVEGKRG